MAVRIHAYFGVFSRLVTGLAVALCAAVTLAQSPFATSSLATPSVATPAASSSNSAAATLPEPVYWSQQLFLIPYKWDSGSTSTTAAAVKLYLSQDRGRTWSQIADAKPEVQFFNYHAPADGEYWFCMRTIDEQGQSRPNGPYQPELRVIVDTQNPTITSLAAQLRADGAATAVWQASDANLTQDQPQLQYRTLAGNTWQDVPSGSVSSPAPGYLQGQATWQAPVGTSSIWVRLAVRDLAGNGREAGAEARVDAAASANLASSALRLPPAPNVPSAQANATTQSGAVGWGGLANNQSNAVVTNPVLAPPAIENWPSEGASPVPLGSPSSSNVRRLAAPPLNAFAVAPNPQNAATAPRNHVAQSPATRVPNNTEPQPFASPFQLPRSSSSNLPQMRTASAQPLRNLNAVGSSPFGVAPPLGSSLPALPPPAGAQPRTPAFDGATLAVQHINSLDFEIGYDVDTAGTSGVTRVELWGTPDGGQSWQRLAVDTDNRSPILAAVPAPGDYGLKIVVETAGGIDPVRPRPGDRPEMQVRIDTTPPAARLTGVQQGAGAEADRLLIEWQPGDSLSMGETVSVQYSSQPTGPWVTAAANLPHNGRYAWRLARHLPRSFYLRLEVRDPAGNTATDQTQVPVHITLPTPSGRLGAVRGLE